MATFWETNRDLWDELTDINAESDFYAVDAFRAGQSSLRSIEVEQLGDVSGRSLLHLQCHFGLDTLSWRRRGAQVMGIDFSPHAIDLARSLASELGISADFICSRIENLTEVLKRTFDIVFTSYGVLCWLADLQRWAEVIVRFLAPGGVFLIVEKHPLADMLDDNVTAANLRIAYPYFHSEEPIPCSTSGGTYADRSHRVSQPVSYQWSHSLSDILNALIGVGLRIDDLREYPFCSYQCCPAMERGADGWWRFPDPAPAIPMLFSLRATRPL